MLDKRAQILLKTLVERYISEGQPIGSRTLSKYSGLDLSPATIRNVMADLEELGFIESPHTSAGRIPTALGYRFFIDTLLTIQPLAALELNHLQRALNPSDPQTLVASASQLLSDLSHFVGLVMIPRRPGLAFRHIEFLALSEKRVLLILVTTDGKVQNRIIFSDKVFSDTELTRASNYFNQHYSGNTLDEVRRKMQQELKQIQSDMTKLMDAALEASSSALQPEPEDFVISGQHNLLHVPDLSFNIVNLRTLFDAFEQKTTFIQLLSVSQHAQGVQIFLGGESGRMPVDACSMVTAPYEVDGEVVGTVGVIGPTRMAYDRVIPIVDITAKLLSSALSYH